MKDLTSIERRALRARAHHLHPVIMVGSAGLTPTVLHEINIALNSHELIKIRVLGDDEADIKQGKISISSPLARALIGKSAGDLAEVRAPGGVREYEILDVKYI